MNPSTDNTEKKVGGVSVRTIMWPTLVIVACMHIIIIVLIVTINNETSLLSRTMSNSGSYVSEASTVVANSSMMSETASNYVLMPLTESGEVNFGPLTAFLEQYTSEDNPAHVSENFAEYEVSDSVKEKISEAAALVEKMNEAQLHAIALTDAVYPLPDIPPLAALRLPALTDEENALTGEEKLNAARFLILGTEYGEWKSGVSENVREANAEIQQTSGQTAGMLSARIDRLRILMWVFTLGTIAILVLAFIALFRTLIRPLGRFVQLIKRDENMEEKKGVREIRLVASAYNSLLRRRDSLDNLLRLAAETDTLTNLPNRYGFEKYLLDIEEHGYSMAVLLFDVNYLKETNDNYGHAAGDVLLQQTAECIAECFGEENSHNCFRFGGDEFAAVITNSDPGKVEEMIQEFEDKQKNKHISVSWGYAFAEKAERKTIKQLLMEADKRMYAQKKRMHEMNAET